MSPFALTLLIALYIPAAAALYTGAWLTAFYAYTSKELPTPVKTTIFFLATDMIAVFTAMTIHIVKGF